MMTIKILKYNFGGKSLKFPAIIYAALECLLENIHSSRNYLEKLYTEKKTKHTPSGYLLFTKCSFDSTENKLECQIGKDCIKRFCKDLTVHIMKIINYEKKERIPPTNDDNEYYDMQKVSQICKKEFNTDKNDKNVFKLYCKFFLDYMITQDDQLIFRCFECKKNDQKDFNKDLINRFANKYEFCNKDIDRFILLLKKEFILMNTQIAGKDLMKHHCLIRKLFTVV